MHRPNPHEALIYLMVVISASDREMTDAELSRMGDIVRTWPVFYDFPPEKLLKAAQDCQKLLLQPDGLDQVLAAVASVVPERLHETAYALAVEIAAVDLEMRLEELRVLQLLRKRLLLDPAVIAAIERAAKARSRLLT